MVCKTMKKGLIGAALSAGALYLVFGGAAPSYVKTAYHRARHDLKGAVPIQFEIDRAKQLITELEPAILNNREELARAEVDVEYLEKEITAFRTNLSHEKTAMLGLRDKLESGELKLAGHSKGGPTVTETKNKLKYRLDHYHALGRILEEKEKTLKARQTAVTAARMQLNEMANQKRALATKLESIQARLQAIEATSEKNEFNFDDSALARAKQTVSDLEKRLEVKARVAEMEGHVTDAALPGEDEVSDRDVVKEFDAEFGRATKDGDKSL